jgi:CRP-like cAMP-binding protein
LLNAIAARLKKNELIKKEFTRNIEGLNEFIDNVRGIETLKKLSAEREVRRYKKKTEIYSEGSYPKGIYFVSKGKVKTYQTNDAGKELIVGLHNEGDFFGYHALLQDQKYNTTASAIEDSEVCLIPKEDFFSLIYKNAEVSRKFIEILTNELRDNEQQLLEMAYNSVRKRVAQALVKLSDKYKKDGEQTFSMQISRDDLANLVGTATETVIRTLSDFKDSNYIEVTGSTIKVLDYDKLANLKN